MLTGVKHYFVRVGNTLVPLDLEAREALAKVEPGVPRAINIQNVRNQENHNRLMALCQAIVSEHLGDGTRLSSVEEILDELALLSGFYRTHTSTDGKTTRIPNSIDYERLEELAFQRIWRAYKAATARWILPYLDEQGVDSAVMRELNRMMDQPLRRARA